MIPLHIAWIRGGHGEATISLCDALRSGARGQKKRNLATVTIVDPPTGKRKRNSLLWKVMQQLAPPIMRNVPCGVRWSSASFSIRGGRRCPRTIALAMVMRASHDGNFGHRSRARASLRRESHAAFYQDTSSSCTSSSACASPCASSRVGDSSRNFAAGVLGNEAKTPSPIG